MKNSLIVATSFMAASSMVFAQDSSGGWRRVGDNAPAAQQADPSNGSAPAVQQPPFDAQQIPVDPNSLPPGPPPDQRSYAPIPAQLTIRPGAFLTVRIDQRLSSDRNQQGDAFSATLVQPVVVDGIVVAQSGQTLAGRVVEAKKAGRVEGTSRLGIQLTEITAVDGQVLPIDTQLINRNGRTSEGRDAAAIGGTTALGAALGAAAGWGTGAAIGAGAGAGAGIIGVLLTRGEPTVVGPESVLTFRVQEPVTVATDRAPQAFRPVDSSDYSRANALQTRPPAAPPPPPRVAYGPGPYYPYPYPYYGYPYWGPGISIYYGPGYFHGPRYRRFR